MNDFHSTACFDDWLVSLKDLVARAKILTRIDRARIGNFGDVEPVGEGVFEMRIDYGPGYRIYYAREGRVVYLLLHGGDKSTQKSDISRAKSLWKQIQKESQ